ncbi:MAG TPA: hypothetical protein VMY39_05470, partial [Planctomycetota bacterium]|nr:hypothetical protein [Planctomycetota bacterium]
MKRRSLVWVIAGSLLLSAAGASAQDKTFEVLGIGGAGGLFCPAASPVDPDFMLICSDMSGSYRSTDGGRTWHMIHWKELNSSLTVRPAFSKDAVYWVSGNTLRVSRDRAVTWRDVVEGAVPWGNAAIVRIVTDPDDGGLVFVVTATGIWRTADGGRTWEKTLAGKGWDVVLLGNKAFASVD